jgi:hypothetical protein
LAASVISSTALENPPSLHPASPRSACEHAMTLASPGPFGGSMRERGHHPSDHAAINFRERFTASVERVAKNDGALCAILRRAS